MPMRSSSATQDSNLKVFIRRPFSCAFSTRFLPQEGDHVALLPLKPAAAMSNWNRNTLRSLCQRSLEPVWDRDGVNGALRDSTDDVITMDGTSMAAPHDRWRDCTLSVEDRPRETATGRPRRRFPKHFLRIWATMTGDGIPGTGFGILDDAALLDVF